MTPLREVHKGRLGKWQMFHETSVKITTEKNYLLTTDSKEASMEASYKVPITRKIVLSTAESDNFILAGSAGNMIGRLICQD